jgi:hypothetical protein
LKENRQSYSRTIGIDHVAINICQFTATAKLNLALTGQNPLNGDSDINSKRQCSDHSQAFFFSIFEKQKL